MFVKRLLKSERFPALIASIWSLSYIFKIGKYNEIELKSKLITNRYEGGRVSLNILWL